jgi:hypothetical protein
MTSNTGGKNNPGNFPAFGQMSAVNIAILSIPEPLAGVPAVYKALIITKTESKHEKCN